MSEEPVLDQRIERGLGLLTTYLTRDIETGEMSEGGLRALLGYGLTDDDVIAAMSDMILASELVMLTYQVKTDIRPVEVVREIALWRQGPREGTCGE
ncbi:MAG: hypothetical protein DCC50_04995 [Acidobacteria bacterium]|nr:MAG: hypothetical protein DCC50_04995 [Acidobacteriota bacterium]